MISHYIIKIPLPLKPPRNVLYHVFSIEHEGNDPGAASLSTALKQLVEWATSHRDQRHHRLPAEYATKSYLKRDVYIEKDDEGHVITTNDEVLTQLAAMGVHLRVLTCDERSAPPMAVVKTMFSSGEPFDAYTTKEPSSIITLSEHATLQ